MKRRIFALAAGGVLLLTALTGCSAGKTVSKAESKMEEDTSSAMDKVESFFDDKENDGAISEGHAESGFVDDEPHDSSSGRDEESEASRLHEEESSHAESSRIESSTAEE